MTQLWHGGQWLATTSSGESVVPRAGTPKRHHSMVTSAAAKKREAGVGGSAVKAIPACAGRRHAPHTVRGAARGWRGAGSHRSCSRFARSVSRTSRPRSQRQQRVSCVQGSALLGPTSFSVFSRCQPTVRMFFAAAKCQADSPTVRNFSQWPTISLDPLCRGIQNNTSRSIRRLAARRWVGHEQE